MLVNKQKTSAETVQYNDFMPIRIVEIELGQPLPTINALNNETGESYRLALCLIRLHDQPLGLIKLQLDEQEVHPREYMEPIWHAFANRINDHLRLDDLPTLTKLEAHGLLSPHEPRCIELREHFLDDAPFVSIIVPTHNRPTQLMKCVHSLLALHYTRYEIIVVDNAPSTTATAKLVQNICLHNPHVHYEREDRPGTSWARNRGIIVAQGEILAFTDDDIVVDRYWLIELTRAFKATMRGRLYGPVTYLKSLWALRSTHPTRV